MEQHKERWAARAELPDGGEDEARGRCVVFQSLIDAKFIEIMSTFFRPEELADDGRVKPATKDEDQ